MVNGSDASDRAAEYLAAGFRYVLEGEVEEGIVEVAGLLLRGDGAMPLRGMAFRDSHSGEVRHTPRRAPITDLDSLPMPAWDLIDAEPYRAAWTEAHGYFSMNMVSSRGCPYRCNWCAKPIWGDSYHCRSARLVARRDAGNQDALPARSPLVRRRHLRALAAVDARVRRRGGSAGRADSVQDAIALRPDDAPHRGRAARARDAPKSGWAWNRARRRCSTPWTRARASGRSTKRAKICAATGFAPASFCNSAIPARRGRKSRRPSRWCARRGPTISASRSPIRCRARRSTAWSRASWVPRRIGPTATTWT